MKYLNLSDVRDLGKDVIELPLKERIRINQTYLMLSNTITGRAIQDMIPEDLRDIETSDQAVDAILDIVPTDLEFDGIIVGTDWSEPRDCTDLARMMTTKLGIRNSKQYAYKLAKRYKLDYHYKNVLGKAENVPVDAELEEPKWLNFSGFADDDMDGVLKIPTEAKEIIEKMMRALNAFRNAKNMSWDVYCSEIVPKLNKIKAEMKPEHVERYLNFSEVSEKYLWHYKTGAPAWELPNKVHLFGLCLTDLMRNYQVEKYGCNIIWDFDEIAEDGYGRTLTGYGRWFCDDKRFAVERDGMVWVEPVRDSKTGEQRISETRTLELKMKRAHETPDYWWETRLHARYSEILSRKKIHDVNKLNQQLIKGLKARQRLEEYDQYQSGGFTGIYHLNVNPGNEQLRFNFWLDAGLGGDPLYTEVVVTPSMRRGIKIRVDMLNGSEWISNVKDIDPLCTYVQESFYHVLMEEVE